MKRSIVVRLVTAAFVLVAMRASAQITVESLTGPVTSAELASFKAYMQTRSMAESNLGNAWVYGSSGTDMEALGMMYEITGDLALLDRMIQYADKALSVRNDPVTGRIIWTGRRELCWPNKTLTAADAAYCGSESGDVVGHIAYCAKLILKTPGIWSQIVPVGDPRGYGATYAARAHTYVTEMDRTLDTFMTPSFVSTTDGLHYRWPNSDGFGLLGSSYQGNRGRPIPWNQQTMISNGYLRLAECHEILGDPPARVAEYDAIVKANIQWFLGDLRPGQRDGYPVYDWGYSLGRTGEDTGHGQYDMWGLCRSFHRGTYGVSRDTMVGFTNTLIFVIYDPATNSYAQRVNGSLVDGTRSNIHPVWTCLAPYRRTPRDVHLITAASNRSRAATSPIDAAFLFMNRHHRHLNPNPGPDPTPLPTVPPTPTPAPRPTPPLGTNLAKGKPASASTNWSSSFNAPKAFDGVDTTRWSASAASATNQWLAVDLLASTAYNCVQMKEINFKRATSHVLQASDDGASWFDIPDTQGATIGALKTTCFETLTSRHVRLLMHEARQTGALKEPTINEVAVHFQDRPPELSVPITVRAEATGPDGAAVALSAHAYDEVDGVVPVQFDPPSGSTFPLGTTAVTASARDSVGNTATATFDVVVADTTPPVIERLAASPSSIWPPNHKMVRVDVAVQVSEAVDRAPVTRIARVESNEPADGTGDGDTSPDWTIAGELALEVRAERAGSGSGRVYAITVESRDAAGNTSTRVVEVVVPHSHGLP